VARCDVVTENFGPGVTAKLHLGYEELRAVKPDIIMASMPAAGLFGPLKDIRTYGMSLSSITGLDSLTGYRDGPPIPVENAFADPLGAVIGALGVILALHHRDRTGQGQHVDYSQGRHAADRPGLHGLRAERSRGGSDRQPAPAGRRRAPRRLPLRGG
jgi:benzylsuccinate CoA-transferase BbsF subunit